MSYASGIINDVGLYSKRYKSFQDLPEAGRLPYSFIRYQATYNAGRNSSVSSVALMMPPIMA